MPKRKLSTITTRTVKKARISTRRKRSRRNGGQLPGDGATFTLEMAIPRSRFSNQATTFSILQSFAIESWFTNSTSNPTYTNVSLSLSQIDQVSALQAVFDQYKFNSVEVWITPHFSSALNVSGQYATVIDYDDSTNLTSFGSALDYTTCVVTPVTCGQLRRFVPHLALAAYAPSAFTSFANTKPIWLDTGNTTVAHYGLKLAATPAITNAQVFDLTVRYNISFRSVR